MVELNEYEAEFIRRLRMPSVTRKALIQHEAEVARQAYLDSLTPEAQAAALQVEADKAAEAARVASLTDAERQAEQLVKQQERLDAEKARDIEMAAKQAEQLAKRQERQAEQQAKIDADLAKPEITVILDKVKKDIYNRRNSVVKG